MREISTWKIWSALGGKLRPGPLQILTVRELIELDCHITYEQIEEEASLTPPSIYEIIHVHLKISKNQFTLGTL